MEGVMKNNNFKSVLAAAFSALALFATGCVGTPDGGTKPGIPWVYKDTRTVRYQRSVEQVAAAARIVLTRNGRLLVDNVVNNTFKAKINERTVYVKVTKVDDKTTELVVMARTAMGADIDLAAELDKQIALQLTVIP